MGKEKSEFSVELGLRLEEIKENLKLSQEEMAENFEVSPEQYRRYSKGESKLSIERAHIFCKHTMIDIEYLVNGERTSSPSFTKTISSCTPAEREQFLREFLEYMRLMSQPSGPKRK